MSGARVADAAAALFVAALAIAGFLAVPQVVSGWAFDIPGTTDSAMTPTFFPRIALAVTASFAILVAVTAFSRSDPLPLLTMTRTNWLRIGSLLVINVAYLAAMRLFGFVLSSIVLMLVLPLLAGYRKKSAIVVTALVLPPVVTLIFWYGLKVALPGAQFLERVTGFG